MDARSMTIPKMCATCAHAPGWARIVNEAWPDWAGQPDEPTFACEVAGRESTPSGGTNCRWHDAIEASPR